MGKMELDKTTRMFFVSVKFFLALTIMRDYLQLFVEINYSTFMMKDEEMKINIKIK